MAKQTRSTRRKAKAKTKTMRRRKVKTKAKANAKTMKKQQRRTRLLLMKRKRFTRKVKRGGVSDRLRKEERELFRRYNARNDSIVPNRYANAANWSKQLNREYEMMILRDDDDDQNSPIMANPDAKAAEWHKDLDAVVEDRENEILKQECKTEEDDCNTLIEAVKEHIRLHEDEKFFELTKQKNFNKIIKDAIFGKLEFPWEKYPYYWERQEKDDYEIVLKNPHFTLDDDFTKDDKLIPINTRHLITNSITNLKKYYALKYINENPEDEDVKKYKDLIIKINILAKIIYPSNKYYDYDSRKYNHVPEFLGENSKLTFMTIVIQHRDPTDISRCSYEVKLRDMPVTYTIEHPHQMYNYIRETIDNLIKTTIFNKFKNKGPTIEEEKEEENAETYGFDDEQLQSEAPAIEDNDFGDEEL
jgi:hypothetical protein